MKKPLLTIAVIAIFASHSVSQTKIALPEAQYQEMKAQGKFKDGFQFIPIPEIHPVISDKTKADEISKMHLPVSSCSCYITPDASYTTGLINDDDGSTPLITLPFTFCFYGINYSSLYINNNGNVTFGSSYGLGTSVPFPTTGVTMIAPFWADADSRGAGVVKYKITSTAIYINWVGIGYYPMATDKLNTFQLVLTNGIDPILPAGNNLAFCYGDMQWTTGSASGGSLGFGGTPATTGMNEGDGINYVQLGRFDQPGTLYDGGFGANDGVNWLDNKSFYFDACTSANIPPIASGISECDTVKVCGTGDTILLNGVFLSPESGQVTTIVINLNSTPGASIISNTPGNSATGVVQFISSNLNAGNNVITFTASDNGIPTGTTIVNVTIFVDTSAALIPNPTITGNLNFCGGSFTTLSVIPAIYNSYLWNNGSIVSTTNANTAGVYTCTATLNGCMRSSSVNVTQSPLPTPVIAGYPFTCSGGTTLLYADSLIYSSYSWCCATTGNNDSIMAVNGTYYLAVTDANGCSGTSPVITVTGPPTPVITGQTALCNGAGTAVLTTPLSYVSYLWTPGGITTPTATVGAGTYTLSVVDVNGCALISTPVTVSPFSFNLSVTGTAPYCAGQSLTLFANSTSSPISSPAFLWTPGPATPYAFISTGGLYSVSVTYPNGCTMDTTFIVQSPGALPTPVIVGNHYTCDSLLTLLTVDSAYASYNWGGTMSTNDSVTVPQGSYEVTVTDANGCVGTSPALTLVDLGTGVLPIYHIGDSLFTVALTGGNYQWLNCDSSYAIVPGAIHQGYLPNLNGSYAVVARLNECADTTACITITDANVGMNELGIGNEELVIYPNPVTNEFQVLSSKFQVKEIKVFDVLGQMVINRQLTIADKQCSIDISALSKGVYFVEITTDTSTGSVVRINRKIIKQ